MNLKIFPRLLKMAYTTYMDMKKKLEGAYLPDKETRKQRLIVGLSGGLNSFVSAYLLKIQKYELIGVTVMMNWDNFKSDASNVLSCHLDQPQVDAIKEFCHQLGIPHVVIKASDEFKEEVVETWVAGKLSGQKPNPCWNCHELRMKALHQKMVELEATGIATGHLAKLFRQESHHSVYVHSSNDEQFDQSGILSRLPHEVLEKLMLPLSDLQQKEINKLAENFGLSAPAKKVKMHECFDLKTLNKEYFDQNVPAKYLQHGEVYGPDKSVLGEHEGVYLYQAGELLPFQGQRQNDPLLFSKFSFQDKRVDVARADQFIKQKLFLTNCKISEETPWFEPLKGVVKTGEGEFSECWIYPKNVSSALIEMDAPHRFIEGEIISIWKKKGKNAKVYLTGKTRYVPEEPIIMEEGRERVKVDHSRDF